MKRYLRSCKLLAAILAAVLLLEFVPAQIAAYGMEAITAALSEERPGNEAASAKTEPVSETVRDISVIQMDPQNEAAENENAQQGGAESPLYIVGEDPEKREAHVKHFRLSDGTYLAAAYPYPVHYQEDGAWKPIDNRLTLTGAGKESRAQALSASMPLSFAGSLSADRLVQIGSGAQMISFTPRNISAARLNAAPRQNAGGVGSAGGMDLQLLPAGAAGAAGALDKERTAAAVEAARLEAEAAAEAIMKNMKETVSSTAGMRESAALAASVDSLPGSELLTVDHLFAAALYEDVYPDTDLEYIVTPLGLKENIVVKQQAAAYVYAFDLLTGDLAARLETNGCISVYDPETDEIQYVVSAPYMTDATGAVSSAVSLSLSASGQSSLSAGSSYLVTVTASEDWINAPDRVFPVKIDPTTYTPAAVTAIQDATVYSKSPDSNSMNIWSNIYVGRESGTSYGKLRAYLKITLPELPATTRIYSAALLYYQTFYSAWSSSNTLNVEAYEVLTDWNPANLTWNNQPAQSAGGVGQKIIDSTNCTQSTSNPQRTWIITELADKWYRNPLSNHGIMLKYGKEDSEVTGELAYASFHSKRGSDTALHPALQIAYTNHTGFADHLSTHCAEVGDRSTAYVTDCTGELTFVHADLSTYGLRLPLSVSHVYQLSAATDGVTTALETLYGSGWRLNLIRTVRSASVSGTNYLIYTDGNGGEHYFKQSSADTACYISEVNANIRITKLGGGASDTYLMEDDEQNKMYFNAAGNIYRETDAAGNAREYTYAAVNGVTRLTQAKDGSDIGIAFTYDTASGRLTQISTGGETVTIQYSGNTISKFQYANNEYTSISPQNNKINTASSSGGRVLWFDYRTLSSGQSIVTDIICLRNPANGSGDRMDFTYEPRRTAVAHSYNNQYQTTDYTYFDGYGRTTCTVDGEGTASFRTYQNTSTHRNLVTFQSDAIPSVINHLTNGGAESTSSMASVYVTAGTGISLTRSAGYAKTGNYSYQLTSSTQTAEGGLGVSSYLAPGTYTFSAYVKSSSFTTTAGGIYLEIGYSADGVWTTERSPLIRPDTEWLRISETISVPGSAFTSVRCRVGIQNASGTVYVDDMQLEEGGAASRNNLVNNSSFANSLSGWTPNIASGAMIENGHLKLKGGAVYHSVSQEIIVSGEAGDELIYGCRVKGGAMTGLNIISISPKLVTDSSTQLAGYTSIYGNHMASDWQYTYGVCRTTGAYNRLTLTLLLDNVMNDIYLDDIVIYKMDAGTTYTYNSSGYPTSVICGDQTTAYTYSTAYPSKPVTKTVKEAGHVVETTTYTYNSKQQLTESAVPVRNKETAGSDEEYLVTKYVYGTNGVNTYGSPTSEELYYQYKQNGAWQQKKLYSTLYTYAANYRYLDQVMDPEGYITSYEYDTRGRLYREQKGSDKLITYGYNSIGRVVSVTETMLEGTDAGETVSYAYTGPRLNAITHNGFSYGFTYDDYVRRTAVTVGSQTLISYGYDASTGDLNTMTYGNGQVMSFTYDRMGRLTSVKYNGSTKYVLNITA